MYAIADRIPRTPPEEKQNKHHQLDESIPNTTHHLHVADNILFSFDKQIFDTCNSIQATMAMPQVFL
jgi:hypothetical protein